MFTIRGVALSQSCFHLKHGIIVGCITCIFPSLHAQAEQPRDNRFNAIQDVVDQRDQKHPEGRAKDDRKNQSHQSGYKGDFPVLFAVGGLMAFNSFGSLVSVP